MTTFVFTDPSGQKHTVTGPKGATAAEAFEVLQKSMGGSSRMPGGEAVTQADRERQRTADKELYDPTAGTSWGQRALENVGAGMDSAVQGVKQIFGGGPSDEDLQEKRRFDQHLADKTFGGGALQLAGEVAPSVPLGLGAGAAAARGPALVRALAASPSLSAAGGGAMAGAMQPVTSDESRLANMALGAGGGAAGVKVAPYVLKGAMAAGRGAGNVAQRALAAVPESAPVLGGAAGRAAASQAEKKAAGILRRELPGGVPQDVYTPHPHIGGPGPSAAAATQSPEIAALERGSRTTGGSHWQDFDEAAGNARWETLDQGLMKQGDLDSFLAKANEVGADVGDIYRKIQKTPFFKAMDDFYGKLQTTKQTPQYRGNPAVKSAVDYIEQTMKEAGEVTPELLHTVRRTVAGGLAGAPGVGSAGTRAVSSEPFVISLTKAMDDVLNKASKGKFNAWKEDYSTWMTKAESAKADINIRSKFIDPATGTPLKPTTGLGGAPGVKHHALAQAIKQAGSSTRGVNKGKNLLNTGSEDVLQGVRKDLEASDIIARSKAASTGGGGSDTASNIAQAALLEAVMPTGLGVGRLVAGESKRNIDQKMQRQLAELLQDPAKLRAFVTALEQQRLLRAQGPQIPQTGMIGMGVGGAAPALLQAPGQ